MSEPTKIVGAVAKKPPAAGKGRPQGAVNKTTALLKDAILKAADQAGGEQGLVGYLVSQAEKNPGPFMSLLGKVLPMQVGGDPDNPINSTVTHRIDDDTIERVRARLRGE